MNLIEAQHVVNDPNSSFSEKFEAVNAIANNPEVQPKDLLDCLDVGGVSTEAAATKLHCLTGRPANHGVIGIVLDKQNWVEFLKAMESDLRSQQEI